MPGEENLATFLLGAASADELYLWCWLAPHCAWICNWSTWVHSSSLPSSPGVLIPSHKKVIDANMKLGGGVERQYQRVNKEENHSSIKNVVLSSCMLSHFSGVWLFEPPWIVACQAPLSMGFSGQGYWSGFPCHPPGNLPHPGIEPISFISSVLQVDLPPLSHLGSPLSSCHWLPSLTPPQTVLSQITAPFFSSCLREKPLESSPPLPLPNARPVHQQTLLILRLKCLQIPATPHFLHQHLQVQTTMFLTWTLAIHPDWSPCFHFCPVAQSLSCVWLFAWKQIKGK